MVFKPQGNGDVWLIIPENHQKKETVGGILRYSHGKKGRRFCQQIIIFLKESRRKEN